MTVHLVRTVGRGGFGQLVRIGQQFAFYVGAVFAVPRTLKRYWRQVMRLTAEISFGSGAILAGGGTVGVIFAMSFVAGTQVGIEGFRGLDLVGLSPLAGVMSAVANTRELAPIVASIALATKVGTGFTAQLGAMRISDEVDALESMSVPPVSFLVTTRMLAAFIAVVPLYLVGLFASYVATGITVVNLNGQSSGTYDYYFSLFLPPQDVLYSLLKAVFFAGIVTLVHCYHGFFASGGPEGVGRAAGRALRTSIVLIMTADVVLTILLWGLHQTLPGMAPQ
ncbi:ABC transporter permease [Amycolatopsis sp. K13G38]|uniref:ABC transporter permease n=1 Tax=Amycolatopsis acididurans TaxID=2724524 RepID=A0ABX1J350_9PSEU|nr:ABC transporter permease [Amycolatopsis acididurans]NKQ52717.1 ABC transporter permease [Amycolatopsis acididurans]